MSCADQMNIYEKMQADAEAYRRIQSLTNNPTPFDDPSQLASLYDTVHSLVGRVALLESRLATAEESLRKNGSEVLAPCPACNGSRSVAVGDTEDRLCYKCRTIGKPKEAGSLLEAKVLLDSGCGESRQRLLDALPYWRYICHLVEKRWGWFDSNPVEALVDWLAAEHGKPEHVALFMQRSEVLELLKQAT